MEKALNIYAPARNSAAPRSDEKNFKQKHPLFTLDFYICFFSFALLTYSIYGGTWAIAGFMAPWILVILKKFQAVQRGLLRNWPLFLLPALAILSTLWSRDPHWTMRLGAETAATIAIGIVAGTCIRSRVLISALLSTLIVTAILCIVVGHEEIISTTGESAYTGIFASKNSYSGMMSLLMLTSVSVYSDKNQTLFFRSASLIGILLTPILIYLGRSLDSTLAVCFALAIYSSALFLTRYNPKTRLAIILFIFIMAISVTLVASLSEFDIGVVLKSMGKESTLTGRTYLWKRAMDFASERPLFGVGYAAFWRLDNPRAQELWYGMRVPPGSGLGFHNEYVESLIDLGIAGLSLVVGYFFVIGKRVINGIMGKMSAKQNFAFMLFIYFMIRTPVEGELLGQFSIGTILFCVIWTYFQPPSAPMRAPIYTNIYNPKKRGS